LAARLAPQTVSAPVRVPTTAAFPVSSPVSGSTAATPATATAIPAATAIPSTGAIGSSAGGRHPGVAASASSAAPSVPDGQAAPVHPVRCRRQPSAADGVRTPTAVHHVL